MKTPHPDDMPDDYDEDIGIAQFIEFTKLPPGQVVFINNAPPEPVLTHAQWKRYLKGKK